MYSLVDINLGRGWGEKMGKMTEDAKEERGILGQNLAGVICEWSIICSRIFLFHHKQIYFLALVFFSQSNIFLRRIKRHISFSAFCRGARLSIFRMSRCFPKAHNLSNISFMIDNPSLSFLLCAQRSCAVGCPCFSQYFLFILLAVNHI